MRSLPLLLLVSACSLDFDLDLRTDGTTMWAVAYADGTTTVSVCPGPHGIFDCGDGYFHASLGNVDRPTSQGLFGGSATTFHAASGTVVVTRDSDGARASVDLPPVFAGVIVERSGDGVTVRWKPAAQRVRWDLHRSCDDGSQVDSHDPSHDGGRVFVPASKLAADCRVSVTLHRERDGKVEGFPDGSSITGAAELDVQLQ